jgi:hypothetical protein
LSQFSVILWLSLCWGSRTSVMLLSHAPGFFRCWYFLFDCLRTYEYLQGIWLELYVFLTYSKRHHVRISNTTDRLIEGCQDFLFSLGYDMFLPNTSNSLLTLTHSFANTFTENIFTYKNNKGQFTIDHQMLKEVVDVFKFQIFYPDMFRHMVDTLRRS